jgi:beta-lactam-binding protein with PASTA domain
MKLIRFLKSKTFFANLLVALTILALLFWGFNSWLTSYTRFDENISVPDINRLSIVEAQEALETAELILSVMDSAEYNPDYPRGTVLEQYPQAGSQVKKGRVVQLTINPIQPKKIELPNLIEKTKRRAIYDLQSKGFKVGELEYIPYIGKDVVVEVKVNDEKVKPKSKHDKGTVVNLVLGQGLGKALVRVPYLKGMSLEEAEARLLKSSLNIGSIIYDEELKDSSLAVVFDQFPNPTFDPSINIGQQVDIRLSDDYTKLPTDTLEYLQFESHDTLFQSQPDSIPEL